MEFEEDRDEGEMVVNMTVIDHHSSVGQCCGVRVVGNNNNIIASHYQRLWWFGWFNNCRVYSTFSSPLVPPSCQLVSCPVKYLTVVSCARAFDGIEQENGNSLEVYRKGGSERKRVAKLEK